MRKYLLLLALLIAVPAFAQDGVINPQTNASALTTGTVAAARGGAGTITGALKGNGAGVVSQAACADLSNAGTACSAPILQSKIITITRDLTVATGNVAYTGLGFVPTTCFQSGGVAGSLTQYVSIIGFSDSARTVVSTNLSGSTISPAQAFFIVLFDTTSTNGQTAIINSYDADGFTLGWTKTGTPSGTATIKVLCYR